MRRELRRSMHTIARCICDEKERLIEKLCDQMQEDECGCRMGSDQVDLRQCKPTYNMHKIDLMRHHEMMKCKILTHLSNIEESIEKLNESISKHVAEYNEKNNKPE